MREVLGRRGIVPHVLVVLAVVIGATALYGDFLWPVVESNDRLLHNQLVRHAAAHWDEQWPVDSWYPAIGTGFPVFSHYQHLSHLVAAGVSQTMPATDPAIVYRWLAYLLLTFMPACIFVSLRRMGVSRWGAVAAALMYPLLQAKPYFGIGWESYLHLGSGLLPQLWGTFLFFPAVAWGYRAQQDGSWATAGLLLAGCALSHALYGYMAALSLVLLALIPDAKHGWWRRVGRLGLTGLVALAASAYFVVPMVLNANEVLRSQWEPAWKWDSIGLAEVLRQLVTGQLFDGSGPPAITLLVLAGVGVAAYRAIRKRDRLSLWLLICFCFWLLLFGGRVTWGRAIDLLPMASSLHLHRVIGGVQVFGLLLAALGVEQLARAWVSRGEPGPGLRRRRVAIGVALGVLLIIPPTLERLAFVNASRKTAQVRTAAFQNDRDFRELIETLRELPRGRVFAGLHYDWGKDFRVAGVPVYAHLQAAGFDIVGFLYMALARPGEWQVRVDYGREEICEVYNVRYIVAPAVLRTPAFARLVQRIGRFALYEVPTSGFFALGRVEGPPPGTLAARPLAANRWKHTYRVGLSWFHSTWPAQNRYLAFASDVPREPVTGNGQIVETIGPGTYAAEVEAPGGGDLVLKVTYHPNWSCEVNGRPAAISRVFPDFMSVRLAPGRHDVVFRYQPPRWKKALFVLAMSTLFIPTGIAVLRRLPS